MTTIRQQLTSPLQLIALASAGLILLPLGYVTSQAVLGRSGRLEPPVGYTHSGVAVEYRLARRERRLSYPCPRRFHRLDRHEARVSRSPSVGRRDGTPLGHADLCAGLYLFLFAGIRRTCGAPMANDRGTSSADFLSPKLSGAQRW